MSEFKKGDLVTITDGSWAVRVDEYSGSSGIVNRDGAFEILELAYKRLIDPLGDPVHDIFIQSNNTGAVYLHSIAGVRSYVEKVKEVTMAELEHKYGCKVKVVK